MSSWAAIVAAPTHGTDSFDKEETQQKAPTSNPTELPQPLGPKAQRRQRLLQEALKSRTSAVTGERWCLGCGLPFLDLARLAQHIADKHGGVNCSEQSPTTPPTTSEQSSKTGGGSGSGLKLGDVAFVRHARDTVPNIDKNASTRTMRKLKEQGKREKAQHAKQKHPRPSASDFQAPEGTHAKNKKRPSRLKRLYTKTETYASIKHWAGVLAVVEEALQSAQEVEAAVVNEMVAARATGRSRGTTPIEDPIEASAGDGGALAHKCAKEKLAEAQSDLHRTPTAGPDKPPGAASTTPCVMDSTACTAEGSAATHRHPVPAALQRDDSSSVHRSQESQYPEITLHKLVETDKDTPALVGFTTTTVPGQRPVQSAMLTEDRHYSPSTCQQSRPAAGSEAPQNAGQGPGSNSGTVGVVGEVDSPTAREHGGSDTESDDESSDGSYGLQWGDTLKAWAEVVGAEARASLVENHPEGRKCDNIVAVGEGGRRRIVDENKKLEIREAGSEGVPVLPTGGVVCAVAAAPAAPVCAMGRGTQARQPLQTARKEGEQRLDGAGTESTPPSSTVGSSTVLLRKEDLHAWQRDTSEAGDPSSQEPLTVDPRPLSTQWVHTIPEFVPRGTPAVQEFALLHLYPSDVSPFEDSRHKGRYHCELCGVTVTGPKPWRDHVMSQRHVRRVEQTAVAELNPAAGTTMNSTALRQVPQWSESLPPESLPFEKISTQKRYVGLHADVAPYVDHVITQEINAGVETLLKQLLEWQERTRRLDPVNARRKRRVVSGMREVEKSLRGRKAKALIVAPNVDPITIDPGATDRCGDGVGGGEDGEPQPGVGGGGISTSPRDMPARFPVEPLIAAARENVVPVVFALSRQRMGKLLGLRKRASAFAVLDAAGAEGQLRSVLSLVGDTRKALGGVGGEMVVASMEQYRNKSPSA